MKIDRLSAGFEKQTIIKGISFEVPRVGATIIMGPAGVGKSMLLRTLGRYNEHRPAFWVHGRVWVDGRDLLREVEAEEAKQRVALFAQKARLFTATILENVISEATAGAQLSFREKHSLARALLERLGLWSEFEGVLDQRVTSLSIAQQRRLNIARLLGGGAECLLLDEPLRDIQPDEKRQLVDLLIRVKLHHALVMITHDQEVAHLMADQVCLITAGQLVETGTGAQFFHSPATDLGREFLRSGNCWPKPEQLPQDDAEVPSTNLSPPRPSWSPTVEEQVERPGGFHWIIAGRLGGMQCPGLLREESADLQGLKALNIRYLISLTEQAFDPEKLGPYDITGLHFPIEDMGVPSLRNAARLCQRVSRWVDKHQAVVLHCKAGLGRTGTMLACTLITRGMAPVRAIHEVRLVNPLYIQSDEQLEFIERFGRYLRPST